MLVNVNWVNVVFSLQKLLCEQPMCSDTVCAGMLGIHFLSRMGAKRLSYYPTSIYKKH